MPVVNFWVVDVEEQLFIRNLLEEFARHICVIVQPFVRGSDVGQERRIIWMTLCYLSREGYEMSNLEYD